MALFATHIQFALDNQDLLGVQDLSAYLSGTIYPDSRYVTKIPREKTHSSTFLEPCFYSGDDFKKGWALHLQCDRFQYDEFILNFAEEFPVLPIQPRSNEWIATTALKIVQEIAILSCFGIREYLPYLDYVETHNGENKEQVKHYNTLMQDLYSSTIGVESYLKLFSAFGVSEELATKVIDKARSLSEDIDKEQMLALYFVCQHGSKQKSNIKKGPVQDRSFLKSRIIYLHQEEQKSC